MNARAGVFSAERTPPACLQGFPLGGRPGLSGLSGSASVGGGNKRGEEALAARGLKRAAGVFLRGADPSQSETGGVISDEC